MRYSAKWKVLEDMVAEFRKKGVRIPANVMDDLKSAKTMISILKADPQRGGMPRKIEEYLEKIEICLVSRAQERFGVDFVHEWLEKLEEASRKEHVEEIEEGRFVPGLPREQKWIRVKPSAEMSIKELKNLAQKNGLFCSVQRDGYLLVYGENQRIKGFVKKMATKYGSKIRR
jgi:hypothetical protein